MSALYPNVPLSIPGVPPVLRRVGALVDAGEALASASRDVSNSISAQRWGIYTLSGVSALDADAVVGFEHNGEYRIPDFPLENGAFESYDKVALPFATRVTVSKGGTVAERAQFLTDCENLLRSFDLLNVVTPERTYLNVNVVRIGMTRNAGQGAGMCTVELVLQEVRAAARAQFSQSQTNDPVPLAAPATTPASKPKVTAAPGTTKRAASVRKVNQGSVQPKPVIISGATLTTTASGRKLYVYDRPPGSR